MGSKIKSKDFQAGANKIAHFLSGKNFNLKKKIFIILAGIGVITSVVVSGVLGYMFDNSYTSLYKDKLVVVRDSKKHNIEQYFENLQQNVSFLAQNKLFAEASTQFQDAFSHFYQVVDQEYTSTELTALEIANKGFYQSRFLPLLHEKSRTDFGVENYWPDDDITLLLQNLYIVNNPNAIGEKQFYDLAMDNSQYSEVHLDFHPTFRRFAKEFGLADIYLVSAETGHVIYSTAKQIDFATNLITGPFKNSALADVYKFLSRTTATNTVKTSDFVFYDAALHELSIFVGAPIYVDGNKQSVLIVRINKEKVKEIIHAVDKDKMQQNRKDAIEVIVVGDDGYLKSEHPDFFEDAQSFKTKIAQDDAQNESDLEHMSTAGTSMALARLNNTLTSEAFTGNEGIGIYKDYKGQEQIAAYAPLSIKGLNWAILAQAPVDAIDKGIDQSRMVSLLLIILFISLALLIGYFFTKSLTTRIFAIESAIQRLTGGEISGKIEDSHKDELSGVSSSLNALISRLKDAAEFARSIGKGLHSSDFRAVSEHDEFGIALHEMSESLEKARNEQEVRAKEDEKRNWSTQGVAKFSDILRQNNDNIERLSYNLISSLVEYTKSNQGGMFVIDDEKDREELQLVAAYAYNREKYFSKSIKLGEGLAGTCAKERKTIYLTNIPDDYINITSGLGDALPKSLLIVPMIVDDHVLGVLEVASFNTFEPFEIEFVETIANNIGSTIISVRMNSRTQKLLEESKLKAEEMAAQEEEMRQNLEELQATQEEMERIKKEEEKKDEERRIQEEEMLSKLREQNEEMKEKEAYLLKNLEEMNKVQDELNKEMSLMDNLLKESPDNIYFKDKESRFIRFSESMVKLFNLKHLDELKGKSDFDFFTDEHARPAFEDEQKIIKTGKGFYNKIEKETHSDGRVSFVSTSKMPLKDREGKIIGTFGISKDVTEYKILEDEMTLKYKEIDELKKEINQLKKSGSSDLSEEVKNQLKALEDKNKQLEATLKHVEQAKKDLQKLRKK